MDSNAASSVAACFKGHREPDSAYTPPQTLVAQRITDIALEYGGLNDHDGPLLASAR